MWDDSALELWDDPAPGRWIVDQLPTIALDVRSLLPSHFDAYARILHPACRRDGDEEHEVRWGEIAETNHRVMHPEVQWSHLTGVAQDSTFYVPGVWEDAPNEGSFPESDMPKLADVLADHTETLDPVWFAVWDGWGRLRIRPNDGVTFTAGTPSPLRRGLSRATDFFPLHLIASRRHRRIGPEPTLLLPNREYHILRGPLEAVTTTLVYPPSWQSPNLWWPDDRAWCVATEIDMNSTYVAGTRACITDLLDHPGLEVLQVEPTSGITDDSDHLNPPPQFLLE